MRVLVVLPVSEEGHILEASEKQRYIPFESAVTKGVGNRVIRHIMKSSE